VKIWDQQEHEKFAVLGMKKKSKKEIIL